LRRGGLVVSARGPGGGRDADRRHYACGRRAD
jgi:DNA-binding IscR family transcriptional regulator